MAILEATNWGVVCYWGGSHLLYLTRQPGSQEPRVAPESMQPMVPHEPVSGWLSSSSREIGEGTAKAIAVPGLSQGTSRDWLHVVNQSAMPSCGRCRPSGVSISHFPYFSVSTTNPSQLLWALFWWMKEILAGIHVPQKSHLGNAVVGTLALDLDSWAPAKGHRASGNRQPSYLGAWVSASMLPAGKTMSGEA